MTATRTRSREHLQRHAERIRDEGQGVWQITIYPRRDLAAMLAPADAGNHRARQVLETTTDLLMAIKATIDTRLSPHATQSPMLCLTCDTAFDSNILPEAIVLVHAWRDDADCALVHGLCPSCCHRWNRDERETVVTDTLRRLLISDLKRVEISDPPGRA